MILRPDDAEFYGVSVYISLYVRKPSGSRNVTRKVCVSKQRVRMIIFECDFLALRISTILRYLYAQSPKQFLHLHAVRTYVYRIVSFSLIRVLFCINFFRSSKFFETRLFHTQFLIIVLHYSTAQLCFVA